MMAQTSESPHAARERVSADERPRNRHERHLAGSRRATREARPGWTRPPRIFEPSFSGVGLVVGALFIAVSLLPSLLPRGSVVQGVATGVSFMLGYGIGAAGHAIWNYLEIPNLRGRARTIVAWVLLGFIGLMLASAIWGWVGWQNEIRHTFGMDDLHPTAWPLVIGSGLLTAALVLIVSRSFRTLFRWAGDTLDRWLPRRLAITLSTAGLLLLLWLLVSGALVQGFFAGANAIFSVRDTNDKAGVEEVTSALRSGSPASTVEWEDLGRQGRSFVSSGPTIDELDGYNDGGAREPIRVYVGLKSADTLEERAQLLLDELIRTGAFDRKVLIVGTTTGTGFLEPNGVDSLEYLFNGDTAIAGLQYSYLPSWISLLADQQAVKETSQEEFRVIHDYWAELPETSRPEMYLYGLSLGSYGVESVLSSIDIINEPIDGALLSGPPFVNLLHNELERTRDAGTPQWLPTVSEGRTVRFTGEVDSLDAPTSTWGDTRIVYFQHGSDPVVFFTPTAFYREPEWMQGTRAPDVSSTMAWFPLVTGWQLLLDLPAAGSVPEGYGHMYSVTGNLQAWVGVTEPEGWTDADTDALAAHLEERVVEQRTLLEQLGD
ncbi:alpha/beta-hydrolase family protein [Demequina sp. SYSU T00039]|uniref:Alpha/beta-hydrolase family protein n=1 Tax=Demequina lignilytica TaxID=3051663 RepID=A0AAW7M5X5_9MICO|nr:MULTISPECIES: alpha/beta-hydrolase family protein [unclassified Demequina]MDN4477343.1 alpha/beta-hydrolase family protein [Demequina sp. SYSU T00039-1]MDN4487516.1 alpha/beta-hydrolase family protein [Demequina sp. SYSU T00039]